jgi:hypothetical protein
MKERRKVNKEGGKVFNPTPPFFSLTQLSLLSQAAPGSALDS